MRDGRHRQPGRAERDGASLDRRVYGALTTAAYLATIPAANWLTTRYPVVPVAPGLLAPAGVYTVGLALVLRDAAREFAGRGPVLAAMAAGVAVSYGLASPMVATASAAAFALSESADFFVYEVLRRRGLTLAMAASNAIGLAADSLLFLWLAFGSLAYLPGQVVGKAWMTAAAVAVLAARHDRARSGRPAELAHNQHEDTSAAPAAPEPPRR